MRLDEILAKAGKYKGRKRVGRGVGSGKGKACGRGDRGYWGRAGSSRRFSYEGGQAPMIARFPKRGFSNANFRKEYQIVNVASLETFQDGTRVDARALALARLIGDSAKPVKVLGSGELTKKLTVVASKFSASAKEKIAKAGGSVEPV